MEKGGDKYNWPMVGNEHIVEFLTKNIADDKAAGVYIFYGADGLGKNTAAKYFSQILLCDNGKPADTRPHGDFHVIEKKEDKKNISIEQIRDFIRTISLSSFLNSYKVGIIKDAHFLSEEAANALLKTLEEPNAKVIIILITSDIDALPATIVSRSQILRFHPVKTDLIYDYLLNEKKVPRSAAKNFSKLSAGRPALAVKFLEDKDFYESYFDKMKIFLGLTADDPNENLNAVVNLVSKATPREEVKSAEEIIEVWESVGRDLILLNYGQNGLVKHHLAEKELDKARARFNTKNLLNLMENLRRAKDYLRANVNPKAVLENIVINI